MTRSRHAAAAARRMRQRIGVAVVAILLAHPAAGDPFDDGLAAYFSGNYAAALRLWMPLVELGDAKAQNNVGILYENGEGVARDDNEAARLYRLASTKGHADAQLNLGLMYEQGRGVAQDRVRAHMWFSLSAAMSAGSMLWGGLGALTARDAVATKLTPEQLAQAQVLARRCRETNYVACD